MVAFKQMSTWHDWKNEIYIYENLGSHGELIEFKNFFFLFEYDFSLPSASFNSKILWLFYEE